MRVCSHGMDVFLWQVELDSLNRTILQYLIILVDKKKLINRAVRLIIFAQFIAANLAILVVL